jgi:metal-dependent amidase/aminoacylase/carboxypeptidase family protein
MFYLGVANRELGIAGVPHMPDFAIDERAIAVGIRAMTAVIFERLQ